VKSAIVPVLAGLIAMILIRKIQQWLMWSFVIRENLNALEE
jgi:hypothetical protein